MKSILIVDDEKHTRDGLSAVLADDYDVFAASGADEAIKMLDAEDFDGVITDFRMAGKSGMSVIDKAFSMPKKPVCIMLTAYGNVEIAVEAMKRGAGDFLPKPVDIARLEKILKDLLKKRDAMLEAKRAEARAEVEKQKSHHYSPQVAISGANITLSEIVAKSSQMKSVIERALQVAHSKATVMLTGETGTGKELIAQLIHANSPRAGGPFIPVHCAAIPSALLESELFGYEKGAFTGANQRRMGRFEAADKGTLFLDEIGEIDPNTQVKLLRFLETHSFERLGSLQNTTVDIRLICATNRNLKKMSEEGSFRQDLYYRLNVVEIKIPPLREHPEDIEPLLRSYINYYVRENATPPLEISPEALKVLESYAWRGNIRELRNFCENAVVMNKSRVIEKSDLPNEFFETALSDKETSTESSNTSVSTSLLKVDNEKDLIRRALIKSRGNKTKAAEFLGISRRTLHRKLAEYNIDEQSPDDDK